MVEIPTDGEVGSRQGKLVKEIKEGLTDVEKELENVQRMMEKLNREQCLLASLSVSATAGENGENVQGPAVLQTYTVPLHEVRNNIPKWREALIAEYESLTKITKAVKPVKKETLKNRTDVEYAPGKLVATVKAPAGKLKCRFVVCGNLVEASIDDQEHEQSFESEYATKKSKSWDSYASGVDGACVRATLRKAASKSWSCAGIDVKTAFLLAPRRGHGLLAVRPPKILLQANIIPEDEVWLVDKALYGLQTSPADWSCFRDGEMSGWKWTHGGRNFVLKATAEPNLWKVKELLKDSTAQTVGHVIVYVDDMLATGETLVVEGLIKKIQDTWQCSPPSYLDENEALKFCGFELKKGKNGEILVGQQSYAEELCKRNGGTKTRPTPCATTLASRCPEERDPEIKPEVLRRAQAATGELLWLTIRSRPDLAYTVGQMGRLCTKCPEYVLELGREAMEYVFGTMDVGLVYGECDETSHGPDDCLPFARSMTRIECFADVSYAPQASKSIQAVVATYGGCPVMWESNRQTCITLSTAESELLNYVEALTVVDSLSGILEILEEIPSGLLEIGKGEDDDDVGPLSPGELDQSFTGGEGKVIQRVIYGDNSAAVSVLCSPDGSWRTRHLRVRSGCLRERLRQRDIWAIRHLPGALLVADHLTKAINPRQLWKRFFEFMQMRGGASFDDVVSSDDVEDTTVKVKSLSSIDVKKELIKICAAGLGVVAASTVDVVKGSEIELQLLILVTGLNFYIQKKIELLKKHGHVMEKRETNEKHGHGKHEKSRPKNPGGEITKLFLQVLTENPETSYFECLRDGRVGSKHVDGKNPNQHEKGFQNCLQLAKTLLLEIHGEKDECEKECGEAPAPRAHEEDDETPRGEFYARDGDALLQDGVLSGLALLPEDLRVPGDEGALQDLADRALQRGAELDSLWADLHRGEGLLRGGELRGGEALHGGEALTLGGALHAGEGLLQDRCEQEDPILRGEGALRDCRDLLPEAVHHIGDDDDGESMPGGGTTDDGSLESWGSLEEVFDRDWVILEDLHPGRGHGADLALRGGSSPTVFLDDLHPGRGHGADLALRGGFSPIVFLNDLHHGRGHGAELALGGGSSPTCMSVEGPLGPRESLEPVGGKKKSDSLDTNSPRGTVFSPQLDLLFRESDENHDGWKNSNLSVNTNPEGTETSSSLTEISKVETVDVVECGEGWRKMVLSESTKPEGTDFSTRIQIEAVDEPLLKVQFERSSDRRSCSADGTENPFRSVTTNQMGSVDFQICVAVRVAVVALLMAPVAAQPAGEDREGGRPGGDGELLWLFVMFLALIGWSTIMVVMGLWLSKLLRLPQEPGRRRLLRDDDDEMESGGRNGQGLRRRHQGSSSSSWEGGMPGSPPNAVGMPDGPEPFNLWHQTLDEEEADPSFAEEDGGPTYEFPIPAPDQPPAPIEAGQEGVAKAAPKMLRQRGPPPGPPIEPQMKAPPVPFPQGPPSPIYEDAEEDELMGVWRDPGNGKGKGKERWSDSSGDEKGKGKGKGLNKGPLAPFSDRGIFRPGQGISTRPAPPTPPGSGSGSGSSGMGKGSGEPSVAAASTPTTSGTADRTPEPTPSTPEDVVPAEDLRSGEDLLAAGLLGDGPLHDRVPLSDDDGPRPPEEAGPSHDGDEPEGESTLEQPGPIVGPAVHEFGPDDRPASSGGRDPEVVSWPDSSLGENGKKVYTTASGVVYHTRTTCGKLKAARRVYTYKGCIGCTNQFQGGPMIYLAGAYFHTQLHGSITKQTSTTWRPCAECGNG